MAFLFKNILLLAILLAAANISPIKSTVTVTTSFDNYADVINKLSTMSDRLTVLRAVWGEIRADDAENMERVKTFYDNILTYTKAAISAEAEEAAELAAEVRNVLVTVNGRLLAETLNHNDSQKIVSVQLFRTQLFKYNVDITNAIFEHAIDAAYPFKSTELLLAELNAIDTIPTNANVYYARVHWNLYLYNKFLQRGDINDKYVYEAALAISNFKYSAFYNNLKPETFRRMEAVYDTYPSTLKTLFNSLEICLENANFHNYFLYFAESTSSTSSSYVPAVIRNRFDVKTNSRMVWSNYYIIGANGATTTMQLTSKFNNWYLYRQAAFSPIVVQRADSVQSMRNWTPSLINNRIMLEQPGYYMCATQEFDSTLLGFSVKSLQNIKMDDANCQWILTDCSGI